MAEENVENATPQPETLQAFAGRVEKKDRTHSNNRIQIVPVLAIVALPVLVWWGFQFMNMQQPRTAAQITATARIEITREVATARASITPSATFTHTATNTPTVTFTPTATFTRTFTPTATFTPSRTNTLTSTPIVGDFWLSLRMAAIRGKTMSGVLAESVWGLGAACPDRFPLGAELLTVEGLRVLCVDRAATVKCVDSVCTVIVYGSGSLKGLVPARRVK